MFKLWLPSKYSPFNITRLSRHFFHWSKQFLNVWVLMSFSASAVFCFTFSTLGKYFPLRTFFHPGKPKKYHLGHNQVTREGGTWGSCHFWSKTSEHQHGIGSCACKSPIMKWTRVFKKIHGSGAQPLTTIPASTLIQMGYQNTHLVGEACTTRGPPSRW